MIDDNRIYVFNADQACFASAVFSSYQLAELWIQRNHLSGVLVEYPLNVGCYDWAMENAYFKDKSPIDRSPEFIAKFLSAYQKNWHFEHGEVLESIYDARQNQSI